MIRLVKKLEEEVFVNRDQALKIAGVVRDFINNTQGVKWNNQDDIFLDGVSDRIQATNISKRANNYTENYY